MIFAIFLGLATGVSLGNTQLGPFDHAVRIENHLSLLTRADVQVELGLTSDQAKRVAQLHQEVEEMFAKEYEHLTGRERDRKKMEKSRERRRAERSKIQEVLTADQDKRLNQLAIQYASIGVFSNRTITDALKLTGAQKERILEAKAAVGSELQKAIAEARDARAELSKKLLAEYREKAFQEAVAVLNREQRQKLDEMRGKPFVFQNIRAKPDRLDEGPDGL